MAETLLSPSQVKLFGRVFRDFHLRPLVAVNNLSEQEEQGVLHAIENAAPNALQALCHAILGQLPEGARERAANRVLQTLQDAALATCLSELGRANLIFGGPPGGLLGSNNFLFQQLQAPGALLARIYAFAYEGDTYFLPKPYVFLVHGPGLLVIEPNRYDALQNGDIPRPGITVDRWGVVAKIERFADDVRVWDYDKEDFSLRVEIVSGPLSELALEPAMAGDSSTSRADMTSRANMALRANMAGNSGGGADMAARANLAVRHRFTR